MRPDGGKRDGVEEPGRVRVVGRWRWRRARGMGEGEGEGRGERERTESRGQTEEIFCGGHVRSRGSRGKGSIGRARDSAQSSAAVAERRDGFDAGQETLASRLAPSCGGLLRQGLPCQDPSGKLFWGSPLVSRLELAPSPRSETEHRP